MLTPDLLEAQKAALKDMKFMSDGKRSKMEIMCSQRVGVQINHVIRIRQTEIAKAESVRKGGRF